MELLEASTQVNINGGESDLILFHHEMHHILLNESS
jgi:hypothetical protein